MLGVKKMINNAHNISTRNYNVKKINKVHNISTRNYNF